MSVKNITRYLEMRRIKPLIGLDTRIHGIHTGTPYEAEITIADLEAVVAEVTRLRNPYRAVDDEDWKFIMGKLDDGGRGRFWKEVLSEARVALMSR